MQWNAGACTTLRCVSYMRCMSYKYDVSFCHCIKIVRACAQTHTRMHALARTHTHTNTHKHVRAHTHQSYIVVRHGLRAPRGVVDLLLCGPSHDVMEPTLDHRHLPPLHQVPRKQRPCTLPSAPFLSSAWVDGVLAYRGSPEDGRVLVRHLLPPALQPSRHVSVVVCTWSYTQGEAL